MARPGFTVDVKGVRATRKAFETLERKIRTRVNRKAVAAGGAVMARTMRQEVPVETKTMKKNIRTKVRQYKKGSVVIGITGPRSIKVKGRNPANYAHLVEGGTRPHRIPRDESEPVRMLIGGRVVIVKRVQHPGSKPNPFRERAFQKSRKKSQQRVTEKLGEETDKEAAKIGRVALAKVR